MPSGSPSAPGPSGASPGDPDRLAALRQYEILDTPPEEAFDRITRLAADVFDVPMALVSLVAEDRQWHKCTVGLETREVGLDVSFCVHALGSEDVMVIEDAARDPRTEDNPLVTGPPGLRFYAGAPLLTPEGHCIGTLCVLDTEPREPPADRLTKLEDLAAMVMDELELRRTRTEAKRQRDRLQRTQHVAQVGGWEYDPETGTAHGTDELYRITGLPEEAFDLQTGLDLYAPDARPKVQAALEACVADGTPFDLEVPLVRPDGERREVRLRGAAMQEGDTTVRVTGVLQDITERKQREEQLRMLSTAVEHAQDSVVITEADAEGATGPPIVYVNEAFEAMTGYDEDELLGKTPRMLQGPETDRDVLDRVRAAIEAEEPVTAETVNYQKDGTPFIVQWNMAPVRDPDGTVQHWVSVQRDVTRRRRMEAELREREEYLSVTLNSIGDAFIATDTGGRITAINARTEELTGWARDEAEGRPLGDVFRIRDAQTGAPAETPVDEVLRTEEVVELTKGTLLTARDGTERQIADSAAPIQTEEGDLLGVVLVFRDVTEKMERQRALEMERQRFKMALTGGNLGLWDWDMTTDAVVYNERWAQMLGYTLDEVEFTKDFFEAHVHPEDRDRVFEAVRRHARGETPFIDLEIRVRAKDGSWRWMLDRGQILERDEEGQPQRMVGTHLDITERKQAEEQLRHERNVLQRIFDASPAAIVMLDAEGTFTYASARAEEVLGVPPEEVTGRAYDDADWGLEPPGGQSLSDDELPFTQVMRSGESVHGFEHAIEDGSGARRVLSVHGAPLESEQGTLEGAVFVLEDVTDQKQLEAQLRRAQKLETMGTLAGGIAHDFNNILHAAMAYLQFVCEEVPDDHAVRTYLDRVESGMEQARGLVRKLLAFSRPEQAASAERVDVGPLVQGVLELAEPALPKRVEVRTALREDCTVWGDAGQLRQVVMNLLTNAAQAIEEAPSGDGDVLDVRVHPVDVDTELASRYLHLDAGRYVQISVSDTGPGMDADTKARVFDPFFTTKEAGEHRGTGLGLSVVHGIVQAMDGAIMVHTERGEGTTFDVYLPDASDPAGDLDAEAQSAARTAPTDAQGHILVVDDDPDVTELESIRLSRLGYRVTTRQHGGEALEVLRHNEQVDLVLTDYRMPGVNGLDLARTLRQHDATPDIPVVLMSGFRAHVSEDEAQAAGICAVLQKPVGRGTLRSILREHIR